MPFLFVSMVCIVTAMHRNVINLQNVMDSWGTTVFENCLIDEIMALKTGVLPLQQCLRQGDMAAEQANKVSVLSCDETDESIRVKLAVFFTEIISGCSCGDEPAMLDGYGEVVLIIDKQSSDAWFSVGD